MPRPRTLKPSYCHDRSTDRAYALIAGRKRYLGRHNTQESRDSYDRLIAEWIAAGRPTAPAPADVELSIGQLIAAFWQHAQKAYPAPPVAPGRRPSGELGNFWDALRPLRQLYSATPAKEFGPRALCALREEMISRRWCRNVVNRQTGRIKQVFKWAVEAELLPGEAYVRLAAVAGLRRGRGGEHIRESDPVRPVDDETVARTLPVLSPHVKAMVELQLLTGMRPGEVCGLRTCDLERAGDIWLYRPSTHKTQHHGRTRDIWFGPKAQALVSRFLKPDLASYCFSPSGALAAHRKCSLNPRLGTHYSVAAYRRAIARACDRADVWAKGGQTIGNDERLVERWHPNQLRHSAATRLRRRYGLEAAAVILGHSKLTTTQVYAEADVSMARRVMAEVG